VTRKQHALILLGVALFSVLVFSNALRNDFVWDDNELIVENPAVHSLSNIPGFFSGHFWAQSNQPSARGYYRPIVLLSYAVDYAIWGNNSFGFHLTNILLHALASAFVCVLVLQLIKSPGAALAAGLLFAVLPVHVESIAFVSGRTDVLATIFVLGSLISFMKARRSEKYLPFLVLSVIFAALALLSKEVAAVLPLLLLALEVVKPQAARMKQKLIVHAPFWLVLAGYMLVRFGLLHIRPDIQGRLSFAETALTMPGVVFDYMRLLLLPMNLCADYAVRVQRIVSFASIVYLGLLFLAALVALFFLSRRNIGAFWAMWIFFGLLPVLQIIPISVLKAERFLYLPSIGYCALAAWAGAAVPARLTRIRRRIFITGFMLILAVFSFQTMKRNMVWRNELTLYQETVSHAPDNFRVQYNLGNAYFRSGDLEKAIKHTEIALALKPDLAQGVYNLGVMYDSEGKLEDAERLYREAIQLNPAYVQAHSNLAAILFIGGNLDEAELEWYKALALDEHFEQAKKGLLLLERRRRVLAGKEG
jgi:tetratricopeptide (TPR) repeat protein